LKGEKKGGRDEKRRAIIFVSERRGAARERK